MQWGLTRVMPINLHFLIGALAVPAGDDPIRALYEPGFGVSIAFDRPNSYFFPPHNQNSWYTSLLRETERFPREKTGVFIPVLRAEKRGGAPKERGPAGCGCGGFGEPHWQRYRRPEDTPYPKPRATLFSPAQKDPLGHGPEHGHVTT